MKADARLAADFTRGIFKLNGQMLAAGERLARPVGLTVAWWQVLGAVLHEPLTASGVAREMGITRQAVQRVANRLQDDGLLEALPNPAHKRAQLLTPSEAGYAAVQRIAPEQARFADRIVEHFGRHQLEELVVSLHAMSKTIDETGP